MLLIIDFGSQFTQVLGRRVRSLGEYCEVVPHTISKSDFEDFCKHGAQAIFGVAGSHVDAAETQSVTLGAGNVKSENVNGRHVEGGHLEGGHVKGLIFSGSSQSCLDPESPVPSSFLLEAGLPILGVCYGVQAVVKFFGGAISKGGHSEYGRAFLKKFEDLANEEAALGGLARADLTASTSPYVTFMTDLEYDIVDSVNATDVTDRGSANAIDRLGSACPSNAFQVWMSHGDSVTSLPDDFRVLAATPRCPYAVISSEKRKFIGMQFHPELDETLCGGKILIKFARDICECALEWKPRRIIEILEDSIREQVASVSEGGDVLLALSGGVDSSVVAALLYEAIGDRLECVLVDHGLLRKDEAQNVQKMFAAKFPRLKLSVVDASERFRQGLEGVTDPERKRKVVGQLFIDVFDEEKKRFRNVKMLAQGTIYPDVIESAGVGKAALIKSHHNVGGLPDTLSLKLLEPIRSLFKDEVRAIGEALGLNRDFVWRHPFPGPGLAVRILGPITAERVAKLQMVDDIYISELRKADLYHKISQALAVLLPCKSVAVKGDQRAYEEVIVLRAVVTNDFMTASVYPFEPAFLEHLATQICNQVSGVSRVVYDYTSKPPGTIEWE